MRTDCVVHRDTCGEEKDGLCVINKSRNEDSTALSPYI